MGSLQLDPRLAEFGYMGQRCLIQSLLYCSWFIVLHNVFSRKVWDLEELHGQDSCGHIGNLPISQALA